MKLQLNEKTLNAYINEAIRQELSENNTDELFGSRTRKQNRRMITGQGWGNQRRANDNFWGTANTDISDTDADEEVPQTLVGMIKKMDQGLAAIEEVAGVGGGYEGLADGVAAYRSGGGFKMKQSLFNAINALSRLADRLNAVERASGSNAIMESAGDYMDAGAAAAAGANIGVRTGQLNNLQRTANAANGMYGAATREFNRRLTDTALNKGIDAEKASINAMKNLRANNVKLNTGFWGKQLATAKNGAADVKAGWQTLRGTKAAAKAADIGAKTGRAARLARLGVGAKNVGQGLKLMGSGAMSILEWPLLLATIADEAARQGAQARQRKIVRTYNCAAVLAKRMANIAQEIAEAQRAQEGEGTQAGATGEINEINVKRARSTFQNIEIGMEQLSQLMKQINTQLQSSRNGVGSGSAPGKGGAQMPSSLNTPDEIKQFQTWANENGYKDEAGRELVVDGIWGRNTEYVYNQVARNLGTIRESILNENNAVMRALTDLENKVGLTGSGGRAYANISAMSGAYNGSRSQGARAAKFIIRTYPPVLNQYLAILGDAGANISGLQPLQVDTRPHRDYDVRELMGIDERIKKLTIIAQNLGDIQPVGSGDGNGRINLPPRPTRQPRPQPNPTPEPNQVPELPELEMPEIEDEPIEINDADIFSDLDTSLPDIPLMISPYDLRYYGIIPNNKTGRITKRELKRKINQAVTNGMLTPEKARELIKKVITDYRNGVAQQYTNPDGSVAYTTHKAQQAAKRRGETNINTPIQQPAAVPMNEQTFKKLIKQIIREELKR